MTKRISVLVFLIFFIFQTPAYTAVTDYLILEDIASYELFTGIEGRVFSGPPSKYSQTSTGGVLGGAAHFSENNVSYEVSYKLPGSKWPFVKVEVTTHAGGDSDKWLLHEAEWDFRNYYGLPSDSYVMRVINDNTIMAFGAGGWDYRWLSGDKVIDIKYTDLQMTKPEPLEVVNAYLAKHPSTLPSMTSADLRTDENKTKWIKDEIERRLWLCDKWLQQLDEGKTEQYKVISEVVNDHLEVFLDYREKYYGISAAEDKQILSGYLQAKNEKEIRKKLTEYKQWWAENKTKPINLP